MLPCAARAAASLAGPSSCSLARAAGVVMALPPRGTHQKLSTGNPIALVQGLVEGRRRGDVRMVPKPPGADAELPMLLQRNPENTARGELAARPDVSAALGYPKRHVPVY